MASPQDLLDQQLIEDLKDFVRIPSQSGSADRQPDIARAATWLADRLRRRPFDHVAVLPTARHPVVTADWLKAPGKPTILIYGHYDVQPPDPLEQWVTPPFEPSVRDGKLFGRGAADDKGGVLAAIAGAEAYLARTPHPGVNLKFCFEGEEEIGSPSIRDFLVRERERFACDLVLSADGMQWSEHQPEMTLGLRGGCALEIHVEGPSKDLHSGMHGGAVLNPIEALARILASLRHPDGRIAVEGFYNAVAEVPAHERAQIARVPFDASTYQKDLGVAALHGEPGYTPLEQCWIRPTLEINGIWGGYSGQGPKTVIPSTAHAKLTCRLVPHQDPALIPSLIQRHVLAHAPKGVRVTFSPGGFTALPYSLSTDHPAVAPAVRVLTEVFGKPPYMARTGGSVPVLTTFLDVLGAPTVDVGAATQDSQLHAPNEFVYVSTLLKTARCCSRFLEEWASVLPSR
jgi:acetylornithine deacetylase/succinyl-diaminopimelate desuccinylase-like protein